MVEPALSLLYYTLHCSRLIEHVPCARHDRETRVRQQPRCAAIGTQVRRVPFAEQEENLGFHMMQLRHDNRVESCATANDCSNSGRHGGGGERGAGAEPAGEESQLEISKTGRCPDPPQYAEKARCQQTLIESPCRGLGVLRCLARRQEVDDERREITLQ
jgi:hypothetical protein